MRSAKGHHEEEEEDDDEFGPKKEGPSNSKEPKSNDQKASATRSKHSVTEQRRRIKINERFQILRDLIPHSDQKRDTASFLLEVIEYVQYLQEKVQKYEGSHQSWSAEPTKLMPWRNSHWRAQSLVGHPQAMNGSVPVPIVSGKFEENNNINPAMLANAQNSVEFNPSTDASCQLVDQQPEITNKAIAMPSTLQPNLPATVQTDNVLANSLQRPVSDAQPTEGPISSNTLSQQEELMIEGGTISISSIYSQGLLNTLTEALQSAGVDLSQASISVQVDLNKRPNRGLTTPGASIGRDQANRTITNQAAKNFEDAGSVDSDQARKRLKT